MKAKLIISLILFAGLILSCRKNEEVDLVQLSDLSVMSFNIRFDTEEDGQNQWKNRKAACIQMLKTENPSVFGIQEGLDNQVYDLKYALPQYEFAGVARDDGRYWGEYNAIFYLKDRFELLKSNTFWLSESPAIPSYGWDAECRRIVTWVYLKDKVNKQSFYVFNTHFDHKGELARKKSAELLVKKIKEIAGIDETIFISGDFNALIRHPILEPITQQYKSARRFARFSDNTKSFNYYGRWYLSRNIDFIFYKEADAIGFRTLNKDYGVPYISDHYPIISYFNYR